MQIPFLTNHIVSDLSPVFLLYTILLFYTATLILLVITVDQGTAQKLHSRSNSCVLSHPEGISASVLLGGLKNHTHPFPFPLPLPPLLPLFWHGCPFSVFPHSPYHSQVLTWLSLFSSLEGTQPPMIFHYHKLLSNLFSLLLSLKTVPDPAISFNKNQLLLLFYLYPFHTLGRPRG